jgi:hypothetical protein
MTAVSGRLVAVQTSSARQVAERGTSTIFGRLAVSAIERRRAGSPESPHPGHATAATDAALVALGR